MGGIREKKNRCLTCGRFIGPFDIDRFTVLFPGKIIFKRLFCDLRCKSKFVSKQPLEPGLRRMFHEQYTKMDAS